MKLRKPSSSGVALIIVLGFLVIISALAVAFFSSVSTELKASRNFAAGITTRQLADSSVQIIMGQIASATTLGINSTDGTGSDSWAVQPGLIRVYNSTGNAAAFYKLYSSDQMIVTGGANLTADYLTTWTESPALWTDLNAPVLVRDPDNPSGTVPRFPIIDPRAYAIPIDPNAPNWNGNVEGFYYSPTSGVKGVVGPGDSLKQRLPMPVRWIYVLQDGTLSVPTSGTTTATFGGANQPSEQNRIVGRIAFWTDDENCKINLNTAAGFTDNITNLNSAYGANASAFPGSYWDTPRFKTQFDYGIPDSQGKPIAGQTSGGLALCQLLQYEFQRYPGHPATTSLAPVLKELLTSEQLYSIVPRYSNLNMLQAAASTEGGTRRIIVDTVNQAGIVDPTMKDNQQILPKQDRLYASVDEFLFGAKVNGIAITDPTYARVTNNTYGGFPSAPQGPITPAVIDKLRFFVTTQSRSPELNLWGQPRVAVWPVRAETNNETTGMNVFDNLMLFCSTIGQSAESNGRPDTKTKTPLQGVYRYIFTRREVLPSTTTTTLGASDTQQFTRGAQKQYEFKSNYVADWKLTRNTSLLRDYLKPFLSKTIPGVGKRMSDKYSVQDQESLLAEIFDYVRMANSQDTTTSLAGNARAIKFAPRGFVQPSAPTFFNAGNIQAKGFGRMSTICEASLVFYYAGPKMDPAASYSGALPNTGQSKWDPFAPTSRYAKVTTDGKVEKGYMRAFLLFSTFDPLQGYAPKTDPAQADPKMSIEVIWADPSQFQVDTGAGRRSLGFPVTTGGAGPSTTIYRAPGSNWIGRNTGGYEGFMHTLSGGPVAAATQVTPAGATVTLSPAYTAPYKIKWAETGTIATDYMVSTDGAVSATPANAATVPATGVNPFGANTAASPQAPATTPTAALQAVQEYYPFQTPLASAIEVPSAPGSTFKFYGGDITVKLYYGGNSLNATSPVLQTFNLHFPDSAGGNDWPVPQGAPPGVLKTAKAPANVPVFPTADVTTWQGTTDPSSLGGAPTASSQTGIGSIGMRHFYWTGNGAFFADTVFGRKVRPVTGGFYNYATSLQASWAFNTRLAWANRDNGGSYDPYTNEAGASVDPGYMGDRWRCVVQPGDTIRSLLYWNAKKADGSPLTGAGPTTGGDLRIGALSSTVPATSFMPHPDYLLNASRACVLRGGEGTSYFPVTTSIASSAPAAVPLSGQDTTKEAVLGNHIYLGSTNLKFQLNRAFANLPWGGTRGTVFTAGVNGVYRSGSATTPDVGSQPGDFDTGIGDFADGPYLNKQDEGNVIWRYWDNNIKQWIYPIPYFTHTWAYQQPGDTFTSPCRQMPSAAMMGSLPSQVYEKMGWQTLSFAPNTAGKDHPGNVNPANPSDPNYPKDHYLLDLFQMPVVEPYPISEPFSSAGRVNLNYRIIPFDYIRRSTALRGALYPLRITAVPSQSGSPSNSSAYLTYKSGDPSSNPVGAPLTINFRMRLDRDETIKGFDGFYDNGIGQNDAGFFKSASQLCERYFYTPGGSVGTKMTYPGSPTAEKGYMETWWANNGDLTGDNEREKPYVDLYPRVTTKSNTYTVHMRVQTVRQVPRGDGGRWDQWIEGKDTVLSEYRGSSTIERYVDPADPRFAPTNPNFLNPDTKSVEPIYRFRTVITKKFAP